MLQKQVRLDADPAQPLPREAWLPQATLVALGAALGEALRLLPGVDSRWTSDVRFPFSVALALGVPSTRKSFLANPVGKTMRLYLFGEAEDLPRFFDRTRKDLGIS